MSLVTQFPSGLQTACYVNPKDLDQAVLSRAVPNALWGVGIVLLLCTVGFVVGTMSWAHEAVRVSVKGL